MKVEKNNIYQTIIDLEGPRHPNTSMSHLNNTADYIMQKLDDLKIPYVLHTFDIPGYEETFKNIIASFGEINEQTIMLSAHYDSVENTPGANDNLSAVAVLLEVARIIKGTNIQPNLSFAFFTLEEGNPIVKQLTKEHFMAADIYTEKHQYKSLDLLKASKSQFKKFKALSRKHKTRLETYETLLSGDLTPSERQIVEAFCEVYRACSDEHPYLSLVGSNRYVDTLETPIKCLINFDCIGWIKQEKGTQKLLPVPEEYLGFFKKTLMNLEDMKGNFIGIAGDINSSEYLKSFSKCMNEVPHLAMDIPLNHEQMKQLVPNILRSDHSPFWKRNMPALFVTDFANFRSELYHTQADLSQYIDYDMLEKLTETTISFILDNNK